MTTARLPVAPPPLADEAPASWLRRIAARYRLSPREFAAGIVGGSVAAGVPELDRKAASGIDAALEAAAGLPAGAVAALRLPAARLWWAERPAWCADCVREDVAVRAEIHLRAAWGFGGFMVCPTHRRPLTNTCPGCLAALDFDASNGRLRLACPSCRVLADSAFPSAAEPPDWLVFGCAIPCRATATVECAVKSTAADLLVQVQQDLIAGAAGQPPAHPAARGMGADRFLRIVQGLMAHVLASHGWQDLPEAPQMENGRPAEVRWIRPMQAAWRGRLPRSVGTGALVAVAAVLTEAAGDTRNDVSGCVWWPTPRGMKPVRFADIRPVTAGTRMAMEDLGREAGEPLMRLLLSLPACQPQKTGRAGAGEWKEDSLHLAWARALLADPRHAAQLQGKRGKAFDKAIGRIARAAVPCRDAPGPLSAAR